MKILLVEDDLRLSELIKKGLEDNEYATDTAFDGLIAEQLVLQNQYDLVIADIILPGQSGLELCRKIRKTKPDLLIIMLTALGTTDDKVDGFDAGADDYLVKPFDFRELYVRIRALLKRQEGKQPEDHKLRYAGLEMDLQSKLVLREDKEISLTPKEFRLLEYLMRNPERVLSRAEIASNVWDTHFDTGTNFIDVYINYLRKKVDKDFERKLIHTKSGMGFIFRVNENPE